MLIIKNQKTGGSHIRNNKPCQDAYMIHENSCEIIFAMADGHGDEKYEFSDIGSKLAVEAACGILKELKSKEHKEIYNYFKLQLIDDIFKKWRVEVEASLTQKNLELNAENRKKYGTTLMLGLITKEYTYLGRIGDGDIVIVDIDGEAIVPIKSDNLIGGETYSLNASSKKFNTAVVRNEDIKSLSISTDGLSNGFPDDEEFHKFICSIDKCLAEYPKEEIEADLDKKFDECSDIRSGDDLTFIFINYGGKDDENR